MPTNLACHIIIVLKEKLFFIWQSYLLAYIGEKIQIKTQKQIFIPPIFRQLSHHWNRNWTQTKYKFDKEKKKTREFTQSIIA